MSVSSGKAKDDEMALYSRQDKIVPTKMVERERANGATSGATFHLLTILWFKYILSSSASLLSVCLSVCLLAQSGKISVYCM